MKSKNIIIIVFFFFVLSSCQNKVERPNKIEVDIIDVFKQMDAYIHFTKVYSKGRIKYVHESDQLGEFIIENYSYKRCYYDDFFNKDSSHIYKLKKSLEREAFIDFSDKLQLGDELYLIFNGTQSDTLSSNQIGIFNISNIEYWDKYAIFYTGIWCGKNRNGYVVFLENKDQNYQVINVCQVWGTNAINVDR